MNVSSVSVLVKETLVSRVLARLCLKRFWIICLICLLLPQEVIYNVPIVMFFFTVYFFITKLLKSLNYVFSGFGISVI